MPSQTGSQSLNELDPYTANAQTDAQEPQATNLNEIEQRYSNQSERDQTNYLPLANVRIPTFNGSLNFDASDWIDDLTLLAYLHGLSNDYICQLFPLCLRGEDTKHRFHALPINVRMNWNLLKAAWLEEYLPLNSYESPITVWRDFRSLRVEERSLMSQCAERDGGRTWELISFSRKLATVGCRVSDMTEVAKGREALINLPSIVRNHLPQYHPITEPTLLQLCRDLARADHHAIAAQVRERIELTSLQAKLQQLLRIRV